MTTVIDVANPHRNGGREEKFFRQFYFYPGHEYLRTINQDAKIVKTADGTDTLFLPLLNEHYHSLHGARQESEHVYIQKGLAYWHAQHPEATGVKVFEVGFGTGLNALLAYNYAIMHRIKVQYVTLEPYPLSDQLTEQLYFDFKGEEQRVYLQLHSLAWGEEHSVHDFFSFTKWKEKIEDFKPQEPMDVLFFDAFAPNKQKNMWTSGNLLKLRSVLLTPGGVCTTYCSQGEFKRTSKEVGFEVEVTDGPPGKREMVRLTINA